MSSDNGAFIELTSSPCSPPHSATRGGPAVVSTVELSDPSLGLAGVRASLSALQQSIDQVETLRELRSDHELTDAANAASPYVLFCQYKYDVVRYKLESTWTELAESPLQRSSVHDRISILEAQLAIASSFGVIVPPDTARRIADLESQLARSQSDLQVARDRQSALVLELRESAMSHKAAQAEVVRLEAAIEHKTCRLRILRVNYERRLRVADTTIATHSTELNRLQDRVSTLDRDLQKASQRAQAAISQRDQARAERRIVSQRLEILSPGWKNGLIKSRSLRSRVRISNSRSPRFGRREIVWWSKQMNCLASSGERIMEVTDLRAEQDQAQERLFSIASLLPSAPSHKRARSESESPAQSARVSKAARSTSGHFPAGLLSQGPASKSPIEVLSAVAADQKSEGPASSPPFAGPPDHLPRSTRSTAKGGSGGASSSPVASDAGAHFDGGESSSGISGSTRVFDSDAAGSDSSPKLSRAIGRRASESTAYRSSPIGVDSCYRDRRSFRSHDIVPWSAQDIRQTSIVEMDAGLLFHHYAKPTEWLIPLRDPVPQPGEW
ncbi:hypothetical protein F441_22973 [Phytophthora nicotianae CJ01A1]|uniref:Uncharacterized protein n=1 Tax=Phytophthora nicotianae CJ01A1 TaxID=1317063 RepID=W2VMW1_PHYNI|nr:hypothetical protein F441_22973 [Phytophthora nicotianae CJ01A1]